MIREMISQLLTNLLLLSIAIVAVTTDVVPQQSAVAAKAASAASAAQLEPVRSLVTAEVAINGENNSTEAIGRRLAHDGPECGKDGSGLNHDGEPCAKDYVEPKSRYVDGYIDYTITGAQLTNGRYPSTTLSCYSSYTKPDGMLICPESRSKFCVKELSTLKQDLCGQSQYFGDEYLENLCVLRKCASECEEGQYSFQYGGLTYVRNRYCCQENYCNSSTRNVSRAGMLTVISIIISCMFMLF